VTTPGGTSVTGTTFTYVSPSAPTVTSVSPATGMTYLATTVTITGTTLTAASRVTVGGVAVTFTKLSDTQIRATLPAHAAGALDIQVTTPGGTSPTGSDDLFTYTAPPAPTISSLSPNTGLTYLTTTVAINGTDLTSATQVTIAGTPVAFTKVSATQLTVKLVPHAAGAVAIVVTTAGGTTSSSTFTYAAPPVPAITGIAAGSGLTYVPTNIVITGTGLTAASRVTVDGISVTFTKVSDTQLRATMPVHAAGAFDVQVTTPGGTSDTGTTFTYTAPPTPVVTSLSPSTGYTNATTRITVTGTGLTAASRVTLGGVSVAFVKVSDTQLTVTAPVHAAGAVELLVTTPGGTTTSGTSFTYVTP
jgi:hypothetical protein